MSAITVDIRVEHPELALTETIIHDQSATVKPISEAGTDPESGTYLYTIRSSDFDVFDVGLRKDRIIADFERVIETQGEAIYSFQYSDRAKLFSPVISAASGVALNMENDGSAWIISVWMPSREKLASLWDYASENGINIELQRVNEYASPGDTELALTDSQREALLIALNAGISRNHGRPVSVTWRTNSVFPSQRPVVSCVEGLNGSSSPRSMVAISVCGAPKRRASDIDRCSGADCDG